MRKRYQTLADYLEATETTQEILAERLGISRSYVSLLASGERQPGLKLALRISEFTGVPVAALAAKDAVSA